MGTVGAVAVDIHGNVACATSTGGMLNKMEGRVGDTPFIGRSVGRVNSCPKKEKKKSPLRLYPWMLFPNSKFRSKVTCLYGAGAAALIIDHMVQTGQ